MIGGRFSNLPISPKLCTAYFKLRYQIKDCFSLPVGGSCSTMKGHLTLVVILPHVTLLMYVCIYIHIYIHTIYYHILTSISCFIYRDTSCASLQPGNGYHGNCGQFRLLDSQLHWTRKLYHGIDDGRTRDPRPGRRRQDHWYDTFTCQSL